MTWKLKAIFVLLLHSVNCQLIRSLDVYKGVIEGVCDYYQCFSITLFYNGPLRSQDINVMTKLKNLSMYFETELLLRTTVTDISSYARHFSGTRFRLMVKPLFVLLNDFDDMKVQFAETLAPLMDISKSMWMIFMQDEASVEDFFENVYIPFNCKFMASMTSPDAEDSEVITEIYRIYYGKPLKQDSFATWNISNGIDPPPLSFNMRRRNLDNQLIRVNSMSRPPGSVIIFNEKENRNELRGFCGEILHDLQTSLNFEVSFKETARGGNCLPNGTCTYAVGFMQTNNSDMLALEMVVTTSRIDAIQYLTPLYLSNLYLYISKPIDVMQWNKFLAPFSSGIWFVIVLMIIIIGSLIKLIKFMSKVDIIDKHDLEDEQASFMDSCFIIFAALCGQAMKRSQINSLRFIQFTIHATSIVLLASYSAILISLLAVNNSALPVVSTEALIEDKSYSIGIMGTSAEYSIFQSAQEGLMNKLKKKMEKMEFSFPKTRFEGLQRVCDDDKYAFITNGNTYSHFFAEDCYIIELDNIIDMSAAFSVQKNSPFIDIFNYQINILREAGILKKLFNDGDSKWTFGDDWGPVTLHDIFPLLVQLIGSFVLSIIILWIENCNYHKSINKTKLKRISYTRKNKRNIRNKVKIIADLL